MKKIILDASASVDNVLGIMYALKNLDVKALLLKDDEEYHSVFVQNLAVINEKTPITAKIAWGSRKPLIKANRMLPNYMQVVLSGAQKQIMQFEENLAWDVLYDTAKSEGKITLVTLSTLTNIAIALFKYEDLKDYIEEIVIMGGSTDEGNVAAYSEANFAADAYAAAAVINSGIPLRIIGLNVARQSVIHQTEMELNGFQKEIITEMSMNSILYPYDNSVVCQDVLTLISADHPEILTWKRNAVSVEYQSDITLGRLNVDIRRHCDDKENAELAVGVDMVSYAKYLKNYLNSIT